MASLWSFPRVWIRRTLSLSVNVLLSPVATFCPHSLFTENSDLIPGMIQVRPSLNPLNHFILLLFWVRRTTRFELYAHYTRHLLRTVCGSVCLSIEKIAPFDVRLIRHRLRHRGKKFELSWRVCGIPHCTWLSFVEKCRAFKVGLSRIIICSLLLASPSETAAYSLQLKGVSF